MIKYDQRFEQQEEELQKLQETSMKKLIISIQSKNYCASQKIPKFQK